MRLEIRHLQRVVAVAGLAADPIGENVVLAHRDRRGTRASERRQ